MIYFGIDNGVSGGLAVIDDTEVSLYPTPVIKADGGKRVASPAIMDELIARLTWMSSGPDADPKGTANNVFGYLEQAQPMTKVVIGPDGQKRRQVEGVKSVATYMTLYGTWIGILTAHHVPFQIVNARSWKRQIGLTSDKHQSVLMAQRMFPQADLRRTKRCRTPDHNLAEALLLAALARRTMAGEPGAAHDAKAQTPKDT